jgi:glycosyltransferase involved in cell wall biosynthesis
MASEQSKKIEGGLRTLGLYKKTRPEAPLITVVMAVWNARDTVEDTIRSVVGQPYEAVEFIVVDGASTDGTLHTVERYENKIDYWISEQDQGLYTAMNKGCDLAGGEWIYFIGADDILVNCLHQVARRLRDPRCIYYGDVYLPQRNRVYGGSFTTARLAGQNISHQAIFYPRAVFAAYRYQTRYPILADYALNIRCFGDNRFRNRYLPLLVCIHGDGGLSFREEDACFLRDKERLVREYLGGGRPVKKAVQAIRRTLSGRTKKGSSPRAARAEGFEDSRVQGFKGSSENI